MRAHRHACFGQIANILIYVMVLVYVIILFILYILIYVMVLVYVMILFIIYILIYVSLINVSHGIDSLLYMLTFLSINVVKVYKVWLWAMLICGVNKNGGSIYLIYIDLCVTDKKKMCVHVYNKYIKQKQNTYIKHTTNI